MRSMPKTSVDTREARRKERNFETIFWEEKKTGKTKKNHLFFFKGIPSSIVAGLLTYLVTSRSRWAIHSSFITYFGVSVVYFKICYDEYKHTLKQNKEVGEIMDLIVKYRGTEMEDKLREQYKDKVSRMDVKSKFV